MTGAEDGMQPQQQYDEWGRPLPPPVYQEPQQQAYDYGQQQYAYPYGYDAYGQPIQQQQQQQQQYAEPGYDYQQQQQQPHQQPQQQQYYGRPAYQDPAPYLIPEQQPAPVYETAPVFDPVPPPVITPVAPPKPAPGEAGYAEEEFTFVDDAEESADVIDWMKFSETRGERRDERRKRLRNRGLALLVALVLVAGGTFGYLWATKSSAGGPVAASTTRTVIAVHLHDLDHNIYTALLVSDPAASSGATVLVPGSLGVPNQGGGAPIRLGALPGSPGSADSQGNAATRDGLNTLLGANISSTWGLYTPFLQKLWDSLDAGGLPIDSNATIAVGGKNLVSPGKALLHGDAAIAYATYLAKGENPSAQLARFGQVMTALVQAMPQDPSSAASDITAMGAVPDPSLPDSTLGAVLAALSTDAKAGKYSTRTLPVKGDGTLGAGASDLVKSLLGGKVSDGTTATVARVAIQDATGTGNRINMADADMQNGGFTLVPGTPKAASAQAVSTVSYTDDARAADARQVAQDLGLPASAVRKVTSDQSVDVMVVLGKDFKG